MNDDKLISVVMASNRIDEYLCLSVKSILDQTYKNIELIFVANGQDAKKITDFLLKNINDTRLRILETPIGQLSYCLNMGISNATGDYIARMDADDRSLPERLAKQMHFLNIHNLDMVATDIKLIDPKGKVIGIRQYPKGLDNINRQLCYRNTFAHNTVLIKKDILFAVRGYNSGFNSEDYDLWLRLKRHGINWNNMSECLLEYRIHDASTQRQRLGYAESAGYALRECLLKFSFMNFISVIIHIIKTYTRSRT
ncbi:glycosyltransferase [Citrobacter portucalensis]|uniref:glycosyltransferase n=1 Tax=Citrobacter portucalensis TaxID=1639133 RepID=UPI0028C23251|nr:glycosyltransferase [Citrobacter portucalensis]